MIPEFLRWINVAEGGEQSFLYKVLASLAIVFIISLFRQFALGFVQKNMKNLKTRYNWAKSFAYVSYSMIIVAIIPIWISELHSLGTFLGLLSAGLAVALKDPIANFFAWIYIISKKPFEMGDRVQIGQSEGDILDIGFFEFTMLEIKNWVQADQSTGRIIHVPNGLLFSTPIKNYNQAMDYIWNEIPIVITFESNWEKAKELLMEIEEKELKPLTKDAETKFRQAKTKYYVNYPHLNPAVYTKIVENGVQLTVRYLCPPRKRRDFEQVAYESILKAFHKHNDIHFAYPTTRFFSNPVASGQAKV